MHSEIQAMELRLREAELRRRHAAEPYRAPCRGRSGPPLRITVGWLLVEAGLHLIGRGPEPDAR